MYYRLPDFSYNGRLKIEEFYRDDTDGATHVLRWSEDLFKQLDIMYDENRMPGPYGYQAVESIK